MTADMEQRIKQALEAIDFERVSREYRDQNECVFLDSVFPPEIMSAITEEVQKLRPSVYWHRVPFLRGGGTVGYRSILERSPALVALYRSPAFIAFLGRLVGRELFVKSEDDQHSCALYFYTREGDHVRPHYDTCGCEDSASYTIILGVVDRSSSRLACHLYKDVPGRATKRVDVATRPGSLVVFNGSKLFHGVTPLGRDEERVVLSLSYVTDSTVKPTARFKENLKDALLYFGLPALFQKNYGWGLRPRRDKGA